jgi:hypothetical protein
VVASAASAACSPPRAERTEGAGSCVPLRLWVMSSQPSACEGARVHRQPTSSWPLAQLAGEASSQQLAGTYSGAKRIANRNAN